MNQAKTIDFREHFESLSSDQVFFNNLNLFKEQIKKTLTPVFKAIGENIFENIKEKCHMEFDNVSAQSDSSLAAHLQNDDIVILFSHEPSASQFYLVLETRFARTLIAKLLSTSLLDENETLLFSSTEKGLLAFLIAQVVYDLKAKLNRSFFALKILGVYHAKDQKVLAVKLKDFGMFRSKLQLANTNYKSACFLPRSLISLDLKAQKKKNILPFYKDKIRRHLQFDLCLLSMELATVLNLQVGDLILLDQSSLKLDHGVLKGSLRTSFENILLEGEIFVADSSYQFQCSNPPKNEQGGRKAMEEVEINGAFLDEKLAQEKLAKENILDLASSLRVSMGVEISRLNLSLKELSELKEGSILDLKRRIDEPLDLVIEGKIIGHCIPVQIDGRLGIKILDINQNENA